MNWVEPESDHVDAEKMLIFYVIKDWHISPVFLKEMENIEIDGRHELRGIQESIAW